MIGTAIAIIASLIVYAKVNSRICREVILCVVSSFVYWQFVGIYSILLPLISIATCLTCYVTNKETSCVKVITITYIALLAISFLIFKVDYVPVYLPIGFSILCFSGISLVTDCRKRQLHTSFIDIYTYLSFFPKILAGPIERYDRFISQISSSVSLAKIYRGCKIILLCLFTKYIVAEFVNGIMPSEIYGINRLIDIFVYAILFYIDFWAYSNLAIGIALLFGIELSVNFNKPYRSKTFHEFWRRWNITLSEWLRDYIYIPLGGNRKGFSRYALNLLVVFTVSAFWHDIALTFLLWGIIHALLIITERKSGLDKCDNVVYATIVAIICGSLWQLFRYNSLAELIDSFSCVSIHQAIQFNALVALAISLIYVFLIECKFIQSTIFQEPKSKISIITEVIFVSALGIITLLGMNISNSSPFIYMAY